MAHHTALQLWVSKMARPARAGQVQTRMLPGKAGARHEPSALEECQPNVIVSDLLWAPNEMPLYDLQMGTPAVKAYSRCQKLSPRANMHRSSLAVTVRYLFDQGVISNATYGRDMVLQRGRVLMLLLRSKVLRVV
jgi:hypothetical protein